jgi:hypothetical protein
VEKQKVAAAGNVPPPCADLPERLAKGRPACQRLLCR